MQVPEELRKVQTLTDEQILELADYAKKIEKHYGCYMDMEWGVDERTNKIWILQPVRKPYGAAAIKKEEQKCRKANL